MVTHPLIIGPSTGPQAPYPLQMKGKVIRGFRRGSNDLGIPTANLPIDNNQPPWLADIQSGPYFGWTSLRLPPTEGGQSATQSDTSSPPTNSRFSIYPMVMSIGYNPFYGNTVRSVEVHVLHEFANFYDVEMQLLILGFIREERSYPNRQALIDDINMDIDVGRRSLERETWSLRETGKRTLDGSWLVREIDI